MPARWLAPPSIAQLGESATAPRLAPSAEPWHAQLLTHREALVTVRILTIAGAIASHRLAGDRDAAEALFEPSFKITAEIRATVAAAGAYLGVRPQE